MSRCIIGKMKQLANFLFEIGTLRKISRSHQQFLASDLSDNIASHSYRVSMIGMFLAEQEKADIKKVLMMCVTHDTSETRSGDQNWVHKKYLKVYEDEIIDSQFSFLPKNSEIKKFIKEYHERKTLEAKIAKDADLIDQILLLKEYAHAGSKEAVSWLKGKAQFKLIQTRSAIKLAKQIYSTSPSEWWYHGGWSSVRR